MFFVYLMQPVHLKVFASRLFLFLFFPEMLLVCVLCSILLLLSFASLLSRLFQLIIYICCISSCSFMKRSVCFLTFKLNLWLLLLSELWCSSRPHGERDAHGTSWWRSVDGVFRGLVTSALPHWNFRAPARDQHLNTLHISEPRQVQDINAMLL